MLVDVCSFVRKDYDRILCFNEAEKILIPRGFLWRNEPWPRS